MSSAPAQT